MGCDWMKKGGQEKKRRRGRKEGKGWKETERRKQLGVSLFPPASQPRCSDEFGKAGTAEETRSL